MKTFTFPSPVFILGAGGHAQDILDVVGENHIDFIAGFLDDEKKRNNIFGTIDDWAEVTKTFIEKNKFGNNTKCKYVIGVNSSQVRKAIDDRMAVLDGAARAASFIHSKAYIGKNCFYSEGLIMGPFSALTSNVSVGRHVHINTGASVNQGSTLGDFVTVSPGARVCGDVVIEDGVSLGAGSTVINMKKVGKNSIIGAGAVVVDDIPANSVAVGIPARVIKTNG